MLLLFEEEFCEAKLIAAGHRREDITGEHSNAYLAGAEFHNARRIARLDRNLTLEKLWLPKAPALCLMGVRLSPAEATDVGIDSDAPGIFHSDDSFVNAASPTTFRSFWMDLGTISADLGSIVHDLGNGL